MYSVVKVPELYQGRIKPDFWRLHHNMQDYGIYLGRTELHINNMETYCGSEYFQSIPGRIEATLMYQFLKQIKPIIENPGAYGVLTYEELKHMDLR